MSGLTNGNTGFSYEDAVSKLNSLQSNAQVLTRARDQRKQMTETNVIETTKFLAYLGITTDQVDTLNCIHVAGTKGKGSTCAFVESLLRHVGFKTGFYSSPHLVHVRERIRINGLPIGEKSFAENFFRVYNRIEERKPADEDMPAYFKFLTLLAFHVFLNEKVDVAIIEVGIGGENDCTNVLAHPVVCGITSLDYDHTRLLGNTIEEIAWQKAGIMKKGSLCLTVQQPPSAMDVIEKRSEEKKCALLNVPELGGYEWPGGERERRFGIPGRHQITNVSLALQLARHWLIRTKKLKEIGDWLSPGERKELVNSASTAYKVPRAFVNALKNCVWQGRSQLLERGRLNYFLDCAHTPQSLKFCAEWFMESVSRLQVHEADGDRPMRVLLFHCTGDRKSSTLLPLLMGCAFDLALFCPTRLRRKVEMHDDSTNLNQDKEQEARKCEEDCDVWNNLTSGKGHTLTFQCIEDALGKIKSMAENNNTELQVLVTGA